MKLRLAGAGARLAQIVKRYFINLARLRRQKHEKFYRFVTSRQQHLLLFYAKISHVVRVEESMDQAA
jgi:hypothetical protein